MSNPYTGLQEWVAEVPALVQPLAVALAAMIPYVEGEGASAFGVIAGIDPVVAALAAIAGNSLSVLLVVLLGDRVRQGVLARRARRPKPVRSRAGAADAEATDTGATHAGATHAGATHAGATHAGAVAVAEREDGPETPRTSKGRRRLERWLVRFGVPGAALLGPLALPTQLTAAAFVASGAPRGWVLLWTVVAIVVWTVMVTAATTGIVSLVGW